MNKFMLVAESATVLPERQTMGKLVIASHLGSNYSCIQANTVSAAAVVGIGNFGNAQIVGNGSGATIIVSQS
jgi:hypothetical protein